MNHQGDLIPWHRLGPPAVARDPSQVSNDLLPHAHVARKRSSSRLPAVCSWLPPGTPFAFAVLGQTISEERTQKPPLTHRPALFAVRHRLHAAYSASAFAPFVVELFAVEVLTPTPGLVVPRFRLSPGWKLPTRGRLFEPGLSPQLPPVEALALIPCAGLVTRFVSSRPCRDAPGKVFPCRPRSCGGVSIG